MAAWWHTEPVWCLEMSCRVSIGCWVSGGRRGAALFGLSVIYRCGYPENESLPESVIIVCVTFVMLSCIDCFPCLWHRWPFPAEALQRCAGFQQHTKLSRKRQQHSDQHQLPVWENHGKTISNSHQIFLDRWLMAAQQLHLWECTDNIELSDRCSVWIPFAVRSHPPCAQMFDIVYSRALWVQNKNTAR